MLVNQFIENTAQRLPDKLGLVVKGKNFTYAELNVFSNQIANCIIEHKIKRGDRVAIYLANCHEAVVSIFATLKANAIFTIINRTTKPDKLIYILKNCEAKVIITDNEALDQLGDRLSLIDTLDIAIYTGHVNGIFNKLQLVSFEKIGQNYSETLLSENRNIDIDLASLIYTSGSTGFPKGVMLSHLNMVSAVTSITQYLENVESDVILNVLPLSFDYGLYQLLMTFYFGGKLILERSFSYPFSIINTIVHEKVTGFPIVPTIARMIIQLNNVNNYNFDHLRYISNTGAHLPHSHIKQLQEIFPKTKIFCMYGLTECKRVSYLPPDKIDQKLNSVGKAMPNIEVTIVNKKGEKVRPGEIGELVVRGSNVMQGYWQLSEETEKMLKPGLNSWEKNLYTGDLFRMDEEGYLYFVSRKDDIIKSKGEKVSPREIENVLYKIPEVAEAAVVGLENELLGQAIKAFIVLKNGKLLDKNYIINHCYQYLEDFMIPKFVEFRSQLPKTNSGKIQKSALINESKSVM